MYNGAMTSRLAPSPMRFLPSFNVTNDNVTNDFIHKEQPHSNSNILTDIEKQLDIDDTNDNTMYMDSVLRKRRLKMKKHKLKKRRKSQRALKKRLGKL